MTMISVPLRASALSELTEAESEVLELVLQGLSNRAIAERRGTSRRTVANQIQSSFRKLGVSSRAELMAAITEA